MDTTKTIDLTRLCIQITNTVVFPIIHTSNLKRNPKQKHVNSKPKVLSNTMFRIYIHRRTDRLGQYLGIKIVFPIQLTMFAGVL